MSGLGFDPNGGVNHEYIANLESLNLGTSPQKNAKRVYLVDASGNPITPAGSSATLLDGIKTVASGGTAVQLSASSVPCKSVTICALAANTNPVVVGASTVVAAAGTRRGIPLNAFDTIKLFVTNLNAVWLDAVTNGEGVSYVAEV